MNQIETKFYETLQNVLERGFVVVQDQVLKIEKIEEGFYSISLNNSTIDFSISVQPREDIFNGYIPDFAITIANIDCGFIVEIDGHEWHEKTKEQVRADKEKERDYLKNRYIPVRFAGSEVYHNAKRCVDDLFEIIINNYQFFEFEKKEIENCLLYDDMAELKEDLKKVVTGFGYCDGIKIESGKIRLRPSVIEYIKQNESKGA